MCSRFHSVIERTANWLVFLQDVLHGADHIPVTHDLLSRALGVHRPSVTVALKELAENDLIRPGGRGCIVIHDRPRLEQASCNCYATLPQNTHLRTR